MKKFIFCASLALAGLATSCVDKYEEVDADSRPSWLGESIYAELKNANQSRLTGTFNTYLTLIDDLGYKEVLSRTGSKTVFPANDSAFARFFNNNDWGVTEYADLSESQKKLLLYSSMLDNALLLGLLPNVSNGTDEPVKGAAIKHATNVSVIDSVQFIKPGDYMPVGNTWWDKYREQGIHVVSDNTRPMMVHLTREYMLGKDITVDGNESDFAIVTGTPYTEGNAYVFNVGIKKNPQTGRFNSDITCQNGYIHQMEDVIVPPGNLAQLLRTHPKTKYFSRIMDHYAMPYYDENTTRNYNDWARANNRPQIDSIFQVRYASSRSQGGLPLSVYPNGSNITSMSTNWPSFDIGWNQYYPGTTGTIDATIQDVAAFFVPNDDVVKKYFLPGGGGAHYIDIYGSKREGSVINDEAHLGENLDSLHAKRPNILTAFVNNLLRPNFSATVPSKFKDMTSDSGESLGLSEGILGRKADGSYDISIANNGVLYVIEDMIVPDEYNSVIGPTSTYPEMSVMNWAVQKKTTDPLGLDFYYYLMAMSANYAFFIPDNQAFNYHYLNPASLGHVDSKGNPAPEVLHFYIDSLSTEKEKPLKCVAYAYNIADGTVDSTTNREVAISIVKSQLADVLNYHTLVMENQGDNIGMRHYHKTKHGGTVYIDGANQAGTHVMGGLQKDHRFFINSDLGGVVNINAADFPAPQIRKIWDEKNGFAYQIDHTIQPPTESVYAVLKGTVNGNDSVFSEFLNLCEGFEGAGDVMDWAGISSAENAATHTSPQDAYMVFTSTYKLGATTIPNACLDRNVKMFNTYNYTLFAPDNTAMQKAHQLGLPTWQEIRDLFEPYKELGDPAEREENGELSDQEREDMATAKTKIGQLRNFIRYHFMTNSVYADVIVDNGNYKSLSSDANGVARELKISGGNGQLKVRDLSGNELTISEGSAGIVNKMTRDYWFSSAKSNATAIETSSFCAVHQISTPLVWSTTGRLDSRGN